MNFSTVRKHLHSEYSNHLDNETRSKLLGNNQSCQNILKVHLHEIFNFKLVSNVSIPLAWLSAAGKEVVLYLVARNTLLKKKF